MSIRSKLTRLSESESQAPDKLPSGLKPEKSSSVARFDEFLYNGLQGNDLNRAVATLEVTSELKEIDRIRRFLKKNLKGLPVSEEEHYQIELAVVEISLNIIHYAYPGGKGPISLSFWTEGPEVYLEIRDSGLPFDPTSTRTPDLEELMRQQKVGGFGIYISRELMDGFSYRRENDQNILLMHKKLAKAEPEISV